MTNMKYILAEALTLPAVLDLPDGETADVAYAKNALIRAAREGRVLFSGISGGAAEPIPPNYFLSDAIQFDFAAHRLRFLSPEGSNLMEYRGVLVEVPETSPVPTDGRRLTRTVRTEKGKAGRKPKFDWPGFFEKVAQLIDELGVPNPALDPEWSSSSVANNMRDWCVATWGLEPSNSTFYKRLNKAVEAAVGRPSS